MEKEHLTIIQRPQDLQLAILLDHTLPEMTILRSAVVNCGAWQFHFAIIGESHFVRVSWHDRFIMQEVLACVDLPENTRGHLYSFTDLAPHAFTNGRYAVQVVTAPAPAPLPAEDHHVLQYDFPPTCGVIPITRITWQQQEHQLIWHTLHTYPAPDQTICVLSQSRFDIHPEE